MMKPPCKNCERRRAHPNCHTTCDQYADYSRGRSEYLKKQQENSVVWEYIKSKEKRGKRP